MAISIVTPASVNDTRLIEVPDLPESVLSHANVVTDEAHMIDVITSVSASIRQYLGYHLISQVYRETVPGYGNVHLLLGGQRVAGAYPGVPITAVSLVEDILNPDDPETLTDYEIADAMAGILYRQTGWCWSTQYGQTLERYPMPGSERPRYRVTYTAGYTTGQTGTLPADIRQAAIESVMHRYNNEQRNQTVTQRRIGSLSISYGSSSTQGSGGLCESSLSYLWPYKRSIEAV